MQIQVSYTENDLTEVFHTNLRKIQEWRKLGILRGVKTSQGYVYHNDEITDVFDRYKGKDISNISKLKKAT